MSTDEPPDLRKLVDEVVALRHVSELVTQDVDPGEVLSAVVAQASRLVSVDFTTLLRFEPDGSTQIAAVNQAPAGIAVGLRGPAEGASATSAVWSTGRAARLDDLSTATGYWPRIAYANGYTSSAAAPVRIRGQVWGVLVVTGSQGPLPESVEDQLADFADLVGAAISGAQTRIELRRLAAEQSALRRIAEVAVGGVDPQQLFDAIVSEALPLNEAEVVALGRYDDDGSAVILASSGSGADIASGVRQPIGGNGVLDRIFQTGQPVRLDDYGELPADGGPVGRRLGVRVAAGAPVYVDGELWGGLAVGRTEGPLPPRAELDLARFAGLLGTTISRAEARDDLRQLLADQAALRRVAELVACSTEPGEVFGVVAVEASRLLDNTAMSLVRFDGPSELVVMATCKGPAAVGERIVFEPDTQPDLVRRESRAMRVDDYTKEPDAELAERFGLHASVSAPIAIAGQVWGTLTATSSTRPLPVDTEARLTQFAELVAAAIANAESRTQLTASRARVVASADEARRRLQRDIHDAAQTRLAHTLVTLKLIRDRVERDDSRVSELVDEALFHAERANRELRDVVHGILPGPLVRSGLSAGLESIVADLSFPVGLEVTTPRLPVHVETTAYFIVSEALANVAKHAAAQRALVQVTYDDGAEVLEIRVGDDGVGGADPGSGSGLTGLADRAAACNGVLEIESQPGEGTLLIARLQAQPQRDGNQASRP